jgi:hypothetical protein
MKLQTSVLAAFSVSLLVSVSALAQQINGVPGSPISKQPRPPPGELAEAALEHIIAPRFATRCGSS